LVYGEKGAFTGARPRFDYGAGMPRLLAILIIIQALGCGDDDEPLLDGGTDADVADDMGGPEPADAFAPDSFVPTATVMFTLPGASVTRVRGEVAVQLVVESSDPEPRVELHKDGEVLVVLSPPYSYTLDTDPESEGELLLEAVVRSGGEERARAERRLIVDRTSPALVGRMPDTGMELDLSLFIEVTFDELVVATPLEGSMSVVLADGTELAGEVTQPSADVLRLLVRTTPSSLPADATVVLSTDAISDLAGNPLAPVDPAWALSIPSSVPFTDAPPMFEALYTYDVGRDDVLRIAYITTPLTGPSSRELRVAEWNGMSWSVLPTVAAGVRFEGTRLRGATDGSIVLSTFGSESGRPLLVSLWDGSAWADLPAPTADSDSADVDWTVDDAPLVAVSNADTSSLHRRDGDGWTAVGPAVTEAGDVQLRVTTSRIALAIADFRSCAVQWLVGETWTRRSLVTGTTSNRCWSLFLVADHSMDTAYVGFTLESTRSGVTTRTSRVDAVAGPEVRFDGGTPRFTHASDTGTGFVALGFSGFAGWVVADESGDVSPGIADGWGLRIGGQTYGLSSEGRLLQHNVAR